MLDIADAFNHRINGTPSYYANAMLKWQFGDNLQMNDEGTAFSYGTIDANKRIITHVSYQEHYSDEFKDNVLILKVATGEKQNLSRLTIEQLIAARAYLNQIKFAGVKCNVVSRKGDILVPRVTVYHDGAISNEELYTQIDNALIKFINEMQFDSVVYAQKVIDAIQSVAHVKDVQIVANSPVEQGVFLAQYDDDDKLGPLTKIVRKCYTSSGFIKESSKNEQESNIPTFRESIVLKLDTEE